MSAPNGNVKVKAKFGDWLALVIVAGFLSAIVMFAYEESVAKHQRQRAYAAWCDKQGGFIYVDGDVCQLPPAQARP